MPITDCKGAPTNTIMRTEEDVPPLNEHVFKG